tara:strand:+ start:898 stop:1125 length:228 start_codon:yes stop_codon:yes gene_type:complete
MSKTKVWRLYLKLKGQKRFKPYGGDVLQVTNLIYSPLFTTGQKEHLVSEGIIEEFQKENQIHSLEFRPVNWEASP